SHACDSGRACSHGRNRGTSPKRVTRELPCARALPTNKNNKTFVKTSVVPSSVLTIFATVLASCGGGGGSGHGGQPDPATPPVQTNPPPLVTLTIDSTTKPAGEPATLTWSATGATSCTATGAWAGPRAVSGQEVIGPLYEDASFTLECSGASGTGSVSVSTARSVLARATLQDDVVILDSAPITVSRGTDGYTLVFADSLAVSVGDVFIAGGNV